MIRVEDNISLALRIARSISDCRLIAPAAIYRLDHELRCPVDLSKFLATGRGIDGYTVDLPEPTITLWSRQ